MANPIASVGGITTLPAPAVYQWELEDISGKGAGRTEANVKMNKMRLGQVCGITLAWNGVTTAQASAILQAFNPEYVNVKYLDPLSGGYKTREFYVGNRSAPLFDARRGVWENVSFKIVQREDV